MADTFQSDAFSPGTAGLNLQNTPDTVPKNQLLVMTNVVGSKQEGGELQSRPGQRKFVTAGTIHHSIAVLTNPGQGGGVGPQLNKTMWIDEFGIHNRTGINAVARTRYTCVGFTIPGGSTAGVPVTNVAGTLIFGIDTSVYYGLVGALTLADSGPYSGYPLSFVPYRPSGSSAAWVYIGDSKRMRKVRVDGLVLPIGLPPVLNAATAIPADETYTMIEPFVDTNWPGFAYNGSAVPGDPVEDTNPATGNGLLFTTTPGAAAGAYANAWDHAIAVNMEYTGDQPASDSDYIQFWLKMDKPELISTIQIDFGLGGDGDGNFYTKQFRPADFTNTTAPGTQTAIEGEDLVARHQQLDKGLDEIADDRTIVQVPRAQRQQKNIQSIPAATGGGTWTEFGTYGVVLRRGDFLRRGNDESVSWADVQSITLTVFVNTNDPVEVSLSGMRMLGGYGPDTGEFGLSSYDYRYINYDTRSGAKSNPSPEMSAGVDVLRNAINVTPLGLGDSSIRQWFYRRGGTLNDAWYFIGANTADGQTFLDTYSDAAAAQGSLLEFDNYQPVPTADENGNTVLAQPLYSLFGPANDYLFGCGDPYNPGSVYYCKRGLPDSWPPGNRVEVCAPSELLQAGGVYGGQPFVFSTQRLYNLIPNAGTLGAVTSVPTSCTHGLYARWAFCVGPGGIYFMAYDGIYSTSGGPEVYMSLDIQALFTGDIRNGYYPIDMTVKEALRMEIHDNDLWFLYQDTKGGRNAMVYSFLAKYWRHYSFYNPLACVVHDGTVPRLLLGGFRTGASYVHEGASDDTHAINCTIQTPYIDFGFPRQYKTLGDAFFDAARNSVPFTVVPSLDNGQTTLPTITINDQSQADL